MFRYHKGHIVTLVSYCALGHWLECERQVRLVCTSRSSQKANKEEGGSESYAFLQNLLGNFCLSSVNATSEKCLSPNQSCGKDWMCICYFVAFSQPPARKKMVFTNRSTLHIIHHSIRLGSCFEIPFTFLIPSKALPQTNTLSLRMERRQPMNSNGVFRDCRATASTA